MPIIGLTDRESIKPQYPRLGKFRKGGPKTDPKKPGPELDHWRFTSDSADVAATFSSVYGEKPRIINVYLPYARLDDNFPTWKEQWVAGGLVHRCDGETCQIHRKNGGYSTEPKPCPGGCKEVGRLIVVVPELIQAGFVGTVTMETGGNHDLRAITGVLLAIESEQERKGLEPDLRGIPFSLARVQEEVSSPGWGKNKDKRVRVKKWNVKLWPHRDVAREMLMSAEPKALPEGHVDFETGEIIDGAYEPGPDNTDALQVSSKPVESESSQETINQVSVNWALGVETPNGSKMAEAQAGNLRYVVENPDDFTVPQVKAARILRNSDAAPFVERWREEQENTEPSVEADEIPY